MAKAKPSMEDVYKTTDRKNRFNVNGHEILNPTPMQPPIGYKPGLSLVEQIRQQVRLHKSIDDNDPESEEEADDFEIEDDPIIQSRWENDMIPSIKEVRASARRLEEEAKLYAIPTPPTPEQPPKQEEKKPDQ